MKFKKAIALLLSAIFAISMMVTTSVASPATASDVEYECVECCSVEKGSIVDTILHLLNTGYIAFDSNGQLYIVDPIANGELSRYLDRVYVAEWTTCEANCCEAKSDYPNFSPFQASGSCTNIFGHSWGAFGSWRTYGSTSHHPTRCGEVAWCSTNIERIRLCNRTRCTRYYRETSPLFVLC